MEKQITFEDVTRIHKITTLNNKQKRIVSMLGQGLTQGTISDRLNVTRSFVSQTITSLEKLSLLKKQSESKYNAFYDLSPELKVQIEKGNIPKLTTCRVHNIRRKYRILYKSTDVSIDKRSGYMKKWLMRGGWRYKFWYSGKAGEPSIAIDVHPGTIVAYPDKGQNVIAETVSEAEDKLNMAVHNAVIKFIGLQAKFNVHIEFDEIGKTVCNPHYGFAMQKGSNHADCGTTLKDWEVDKSPQDLGKPDQVEFETQRKGQATVLDTAVQTIVGMPEAMRDFEKSFGTMTKEMHSVVAHIQSGEPLQYQINQLVAMFGKVLEQQNEILQRMDKT